MLQNWSVGDINGILGRADLPSPTLDFGFAAVVALAAAGYGGAYAALRRW